MSENPPHPTRVEDLLAQDTAVSSFQFEEFNMSLKESIQQLELRASVIRRASHWGLGVFITFILLTPFAEMFGLFKNDWVRPVWSGCGVVALLTTGVLAGIYSYKYQPALKRARSDLQCTMIAQLQQQVAEINRKMDSQ